MPASIFSGNAVKILKDIFQLGSDNSNAPTLINSTSDPTSSPTSGNVGSILLNRNTATHYKKLDSGSSNNWIKTVDSVDVSSYLDNGHALVNTTGWNGYDDGAVADPVDGTGGSPSTITFTRDTVRKLDNDIASFRFAKSAADGQGEGRAFAFSIPESEQGRQQQIEINYETTVNYAAGDIGIYIYDVTNANLLNVSPRDVAKNDSGGKISARFFAAAGSTSYRVIIHIRTTNALAYDFNFTMRIGKVRFFDAPVVSKWESFTPTGSWTTNATYTGFKRRVGQNLEIQYKIALAGAPNAADLHFDIPDNLSIDTDVIHADTQNDTLGLGVVHDNGTSIYSAVRGEYRTDSTILLKGHDNETVNTTFTTMTSAGGTATVTFASGDEIFLHTTVPISGWDSGALVSTTQANLQTVSFRADKTSGNHSSNGNYQQVQSWNAADIDTANGWNTSTGTYTLPRTGKYLAYFTTGFAISATGQRGVTIKQNGTNVGFNQAEATSTSIGPHVTVTAIIDGVQDDTITFEAYQNSGGNLNYSGSANATIAGIVSIPDLDIFGVFGQNEFLTASSSQETVPSTAVWIAMTGNSITLTPGTWLLYGKVQWNNSGTANFGRVRGIWATADGDDTSTTPATPTLEAGQASTINLIDSNIGDITMTPARLTVTANTDIFLVPRSDTGTAANQRVISHISAERIA